MGPLNYLKIFCLVTIYFYGLWYGLTSALISWLPWGMLPGALTILAIHFCKIPKPTNAQVEKIIGKDLGKQNGDNNNVLMKTVAHRGAGLDAPENSLIAFKQCAEKGCDFIEFDITLTKDAVPVVFHDDTLERMANDKRKISECTRKELEEIDISVNHPFRDRFQPTRIPTLDEAVSQMLSDGQRMFIDIKDNDSQMVNVILKLYKKYPELHERAVVTTFFPNIIYKIRKSNPAIVCSMAHRPHFITHKSYDYETGKGPRNANKVHIHYLLCVINLIYDWALPLFTYYIVGLSIILLHKDGISPKAVRDWRERGLRVAVWTANQPVDKQYISKALKCTYLTDTLTGEVSTHGAIEK